MQHIREQTEDDAAGVEKPRRYEIIAPVAVHAQQYEKPDARADKKAIRAREALSEPEPAPEAERKAPRKRKVAQG